MAGLPTETDPITGNTGIVDTNYVTRSQGITAQTWSAYPPTMAENNTSLGNSYDANPPGYPNPEDERPGYLAVGQPGGNPSDVIIPSTDANGADGANLVTVSPPAGNAEGGVYYPGPVNPMIAPGWTAQANANEDSAPVNNTLSITTTTGSGTAGTAGSVTPTISGGTSPYLVVNFETGDSNSPAFPTGFSLDASTGELSWDTTAVAGTYTFNFRVSDSSTPALARYYSQTVVLAAAS